MRAVKPLDDTYIPFVYSKMKEVSDVYNTEDMDMFKKHELELVYSDFRHPIYTQPSTHFVPNLSILDLMFNEGDRSLDILRGNTSACHVEQAVGIG